VIRDFAIIDINSRAGSTRRDEEILIWGHIDAKMSLVFSVQRDAPALSSREQKFLHLVPGLLDHLLPAGGAPELQQLQRLSSKMVIGTAIVAKFLQNKPGSGFWQSSYLLSMLQALVAQNYEGANATTGFLCVAKTAELTDDFCGQDYELQRFEKPVRLREDFFANPISYRYVDGRNAFYVIDRQSDVQGIVRVRQPLNWSLVDRAQGRHLQPLISRLQGKVWAAIVGNTRDIQIITRLGPEIRWNRNRWQYLHLEQIRTYLAQFTRDPSVAGELLQLVFALSASRRGSLILIPRSDERPTYLGGLDLERVEAQIERTIVGASLTGCGKRLGRAGHWPRFRGFLAHGVSHSGR
jgi:hypothetical protein